MTREVQIGGQVVALRATANLPIAYRALFNRDLLRDMDGWRESLRDKTEELEAVTEAPSGDAEAAAVETPPDSASDNAEADGNKNEILYTMDLTLVSRLAYAMAKSAEPSIPNGVEAWLDTLESPNALYLLAGEVLQLYNNGFETVVDAKKNIPPRLAK